MKTPRKHAALSFLLTSLLTLTSIPKPGYTTSLDILGVQYDAPKLPELYIDKNFTLTKELQDHAHFYSAAEVLTKWAETTFALSAQAYQQLSAQGEGSGQDGACVYDGRQCLFNPVTVGLPAFPLPNLNAELVLKRFAQEAHACRRSRDSATCHMDSNCGWSDAGGSCFLQHDPHGEFMRTLSQCRDTLYSAINAACWRRRPQANGYRPCGPAGCRLYTAAGEGLPEDRCMPEPIPPALQPLDVYALMKRYYGSETAAAGETAAAMSAVEVEVEGFGSCSTARLHHAMQTMCRAAGKDACLTDSRCGWLTGVVNGAFCVLGRETVLEELLGPSPFTSTALQMERACRAADSAAACSQVQLTVAPSPPRAQT